MTPQQLLLFQQERRRTLSNITNSSGTVAVAGAAGGVSPVRVQGVPGQVAVVGQPGLPPGHCGTLTPQQIHAAKQARAGQMVAKAGIPPQHPEPVEYYGHHPNAKIPPEMCLLGCVFFIVEYDETCSSQLKDWRKIIRDYGGEEDPVYGPRITHVLCETQTNPRVKQAMHDGKRLVTAQWLSDVIVKQQMFPPCHALHLPVQFGLSKPCKNMIISHSGFEGEDRIRIKEMIQLVGAKCTNYLSHQNNLLVCRKPEGAKYRQAREWGKSVVNAHWLFEVMFCSYNCIRRPDQRRFQQFNLLNPFCINCDAVPHLMGPWTNPILVTLEAYERAKGNVSPLRKKPRLEKDLDWSQENSKDEEMDTNSIAQTDSKEGKPIVLLSSVKDIAGLQQKIHELGGSITKVCREATHLIMSKPQRTVKFLCSISCVQYILSESWILDCYTHKKFLDEKNYALQDPEFESSNNFTFAELLTAPKRNDLFKNKIFYITPGVVPTPAYLREIIEHAGGTVDKHRRPLKEILELNASVGPSFGAILPNHFHGSPHNSVPSMSVTPVSATAVNYFHNPSLNSAVSDSNSQPSTMNGPMSNTISANHAVSSQKNDVNVDGTNNSTASMACSTSSSLGASTSVANGNSSLMNPDETLALKSDIKTEIASEITDGCGKELKLEADSNQDTKKKDFMNEIDDKKRDPQEFMKPAVPVAFPAAREVKLPGSEKKSDGKKEPTYLVISVLNDLHLVKDLMKAKIGIYNAEFVMSSILQQKIDFDSAIYEPSIDNPR